MSPSQARRKPGSFEGLPRGDVVLLQGHHDAVLRGVATPALGGEPGDHEPPDSPADEIRLPDEVVDADASGVAEGGRDRLTPLRVVVDQVALDIADGPTAEVDDEPFGGIGTVHQRAVVLLDGRPVRRLPPPSSDVGTGQPGCQQREVAGSEGLERDVHVLSVQDCRGVQCAGYGCDPTQL